MTPDLIVYNSQQEATRKEICDALAQELHKNLPEAESKLWHGAPVWFLNGNPIVGYANRKNSVSLLFWSGQSFDEPALRAEGTFKAAEVRYTSLDEISADHIAHWVKKAKKIQWDYKNIVKRKGKLERLDI